ncbi:MAG: hypothetical protein N2319_01270 [Candidatus Kapabacteria bacterium]|nr:hypothetical protein [Candidatus Kapabacteria bacterium]
MARTKKILTFIFGIYFLNLLAFSYFPLGHTCHSCNSDNECSISEESENDNDIKFNEPHSCLLCILITTAQKTITIVKFTFESNQTSILIVTDSYIYFFSKECFNQLYVRGPPLFS